MEISHRSKTFAAVLEQAKGNLAKLLNLPDNYQVLFLQGGASLQFSMLAMNFLRGEGKTADYILTGSWGSKAYKEAQKEGKPRAVSTSTSTIAPSSPMMAQVVTLASMMLLAYD